MPATIGFDTLLPFAIVYFFQLSTPILVFWGSVLAWRRLSKRVGLSLLLSSGVWLGGRLTMLAAYGVTWPMGEAVLSNPLIPGLVMWGQAVNYAGVFLFGLAFFQLGWSLKSQRRGHQRR